MKGFFITTILFFSSKPFAVKGLINICITGTPIEIMVGHQKFTTMLLTILIIAGITGFAIFYQAIKFFEKI